MQTQKRRTNAKGVRRIEQILAATRNMIINEGAGALTMRRLAATLGMSLSNLQHYFPTKENLINVLVDTAYDTHIERVQKEVFVHGDPRDQMKALAHYLVQDTQVAGNSVLLWELWALAAHNDYIASIINQAHDGERRLIQQIVKTAAPHLSSSQLELKAIAITSMFEGVGLFIAPGKPFNKRRKAVVNQLTEAAIAIIHA